MGEPDASPKKPGRLTRDSSPKCGLSTHFFMLSELTGEKAGMRV